MSERMTPAVRNIVLNPSFKIGTLGWSGDATVSGVTQTWQRSTARPWVGAYAARNEITANTAAAGQATRYTYQNIPIVAGAYYAFSAVSYRSTPDLTPRLQATWFDAAGTFLSVPGDIREPADPNQTAQTRHELSLQQAPETAASCKIVLLNTFAVANAIGVVDWDGVQVEQAEQSGIYTDGDQPGCVWEGVPHDSPSYRAPVLWQGVSYSGGPKRLIRRVYRATRENQRLDEITDLMVSGTVSNNIDRVIHGQAEFGLRSPLAVQPYRDYLVPEVTLTELVSGDTETVQLGLFRVRLPGTTRYPTLVTGKIRGEDLVSHLVDRKVGAPYNVAAAANIIAACRAVCDLADLRHLFPEDARTLPAGQGRSWPIGTSLYRILTDLLEMLGFVAPWADREGRIRSQLFIAPADQAPATTYRDGEASNLIGVVDTDPLDTSLANHIIVTHEDLTTGVVLVAERINDDPTSATNIDPDTGIGELARHITISEAADQAAVDALADQYASEMGDVLQRVTIRTPMEPAHDAWETYALAIQPDAADGGLQGVYRVSGFAHSLDNGSTVHELRRAEPFKRVTL